MQAKDDRQLEKAWEELYRKLDNSNLPEPVDFSESTKYPQVFYKFMKSEVRAVCNVFEKAGLGPTAQQDWSVLWCNGALKENFYRNLSPFQKINHFPSITEITRKDKLCANMVEMQEVYGRKAFEFIPDTYVLPEEFADFYAHFHNDRESSWIVKPPASSQGKGIFIVNSVNQVPLDQQLIISKYIQNPLLINGLKFDIRIYVLVTSFEPLRIYMYKEGLVRFACEPFSKDNINNVYSHLTNYSINKRNGNYIKNVNYTDDDFGHKWSLSGLLRHLENSGVDTDYIMGRIHDLIIKTIITAEPFVSSACNKLNCWSNCFDLLGLDVILDSNFKPWLLEVNLSPSLAIGSPLDEHVKTNLLTDTFNLVGVRPYVNKNTRTTLPYKNPRKAKLTKSNRFMQALRDTLEEFKRKGNFLRVYPAQGTDYYEKFFQPPKVINKALYKTLFFKETEVRSVVVEKPVPFLEATNTPGKVVITGDDVLLEYMSRIWHALRAIKEEKLSFIWKRCLEKFIMSPVWKSSDGSKEVSLKLWQRLETRLIEMKHRQQVFSKLKDPRKKSVLREFSAAELESMLKQTSGDSSIELVATLINREGHGILSQIINWLGKLDEEEEVLVSQKEIQLQQPIYYESDNDA